MKAATFSFSVLLFASGDAAAQAQGADTSGNTFHGDTRAAVAPNNRNQNSNLSSLGKAGSNGDAKKEVEEKPGSSGIVTPGATGPNEDQGSNH